MNRLRILLSVVTVVSLTLVTNVCAQPRFEIPLTVSDGAITQTVYFGILPQADPCINSQDSINGHIELFLPGPPPPSGSVEARFVWPRSGSGNVCFDQGSQCDYRPFSAYTQRDTFRVNIFPGVTAPPVSISWPAGLSSYFSGLTLKDVATNGGTHNVNMLSSTSVVVNLNPADIKIYASGPHNPHDTMAVNVQITMGWNLVSNPVITANDSIPFLFPACIGCPLSPPFPPYFNCRLPHGKGAWIKCPAGGVVTITGMSITADTIAVSRGWNLIGSISYPVATSSITSIPPGIIVSGFFGYVMGYMAAYTIQPGRGYWVKANQAGRIVISSDF